MKRQKTIKTLVIGGAIVILLSLTTQKKEKTTFGSLALDNIEALAGGEIEEGEQKISCWGTGDLICPLMGEKVEDYIIRWSLR